jgi:hypothetical protein
MQRALGWLHHAHRSRILPATLQAAYFGDMPTPHVADTATASRF